MAVGDAVRHLREQHGWTQQKLGDLTRSRSATISNIEANKHHHPRQDTLMRLAAAFDISVDRLIQIGQDLDAPRPPEAAPTALPSPATQDSRLLTEMESLLVEGRERGFTLDKEALVQQLRIDQVRTILLTVLDSPRDDQIAIARHAHALWHWHQRQGQPPTPEGST